MAFLNNSGDIIVDAVLTDIGRQQLARGRSIVNSFALADDEIDYGLYNASNPSGSAYYDLNILQTPIFEPSTLSQGSLKSKLFSYADQTLQYLPVLKMNQSQLVSSNLTILENSGDNLNSVVVLANDTAITTVGQTVVASTKYFIDGRRNTGNTTLTTNSSLTTRIASTAGSLTSRFIRVSQGFDTATVTPALGSLEEVNFSVYVNRLFLKVVDKSYNFAKEPAVIASPFSRTQATDVYKLSVNTDPTYFGDIESTTVNNATTLATSLAASLPQQVGKEIQFSLQLSDFVANNPSYYFTTYGTDATLTLSSTSNTYKIINTFVRVVGDNYGFSIDVPVTLVYKS